MLEWVGKLDWLGERYGTGIKIWRPKKESKRPGTIMTVTRGMLTAYSCQWFCVSLGDRCLKSGFKVSFFACRSCECRCDATYCNCGVVLLPFFFNIGKLHINYTTKIILLNFEKTQALENAKIMALIHFMKSFKYTVSLVFYGTLS